MKEELWKRQHIEDEFGSFIWYVIVAFVSSNKRTTWDNNVSKNNVCVEWMAFYVDIVSLVVFAIWIITRR